MKKNYFIQSKKVKLRSIDKKAEMFAEYLVNVLQLFLSEIPAEAEYITSFFETPLLKSNIWLRDIEIRKKARDLTS